jgi:GMP synthase (glutamine-hydrolysing)
VRVLSIVHGNDARSGVFGDVVREAGHELDELSFAFGDPPLEPETYDAVLVFGGSMNVHEIDGHPWLTEEGRALERVLEAGVPTFGVCLGAQLLASVAGAKVSRAAQPEIGWHEVELTPEAGDDPIFHRLPERFTACQWHSYQFDLPAGATLLARSPVCLQAYRLGDSAWGTQFHGEVTREIFGRWIDNYGTDPDAVRLGFDTGGERKRLDREIDRWNELGRSLVGGFLEVAGARAGAPGAPAAPTHA